MPRSLPAAVIRALRRPRWSADDAHLVLDALASSGLSVPDFSREHSVDPQRLYAWRRRLDARAPNSTDTPLTFVRLQPALPSATPNPRYELVLNGGEMLRIEGTIVPHDIVALLAALRGTRPC